MFGLGKKTTLTPEEEAKIFCMEEPGSETDTAVTSGNSLIERAYKAAQIHSQERVQFLKNIDEICTMNARMALYLRAGNISPRAAQYIAAELDVASGNLLRLREMVSE